MKRTNLLVAMLLAVCGTAAFAQEAEDTAKKEKKICRSEKATGSLTRVTRICMTKAQWDELSSRTKKALDDTVRDASGGMAASNNPGL